MVTRPPQSPNTGHEGDWYVPVIGMGAGSVIGEGMQALKTKWAEALRLMSGRASLPTTENIASMAGGINASGPGAEAARAAGTSIGDIAKLAETNPEQAKQLADSFMKHYQAGARRVTPQEFMRTSESLGVDKRLYPGNVIEQAETMGGMVPRPDVMDRVMNSGLRNKILGFGNQP